jgi:hypothetical protein
MRVAYLLTWQYGSASGVFRKVVDQVGEWERQGVEAAVFVATTPAFADDWLSVPQASAVVPFSGAVESLRAQSTLLDRIRTWAPDITYVRSSPRQASAALNLRRLPRVIEIQSDDLAEARLTPLPRRALTLVTRRACLSGATGMVFVSRELSRSPSYAFTSRHRTVIGNGIDLARVQTLPPAPSGEPLRLAFIGQGALRWHGIEEVYALAQARPGWNVDMIGMTADDPRTTPSNVTHHGVLSISEYLPILARATVGLGTLALFTKGMHEASPLKSREYLARGLPVIGAYEDTDIPPSSPVFLRLPNEPGSIVRHLDDVEAFIDSWRGRRVQHEQIEYLDTSVKEAQRLEFLRQCIARARR